MANGDAGNTYTAFILQLDRRVAAEPTDGGAAVLEGERDHPGVSIHGRCGLVHLERGGPAGDGRVLALGSPSELKSTYGAQTIFDLKLKSNDGLDPVVATLKARPDVTNAEATPNGLRVMAAGSEGLLPDLVQMAARFGLRDLEITEPSLETVFIQLTGRDLRE